MDLLAEFEAILSGKLTDAQAEAALKRLDKALPTDTPSPLMKPLVRKLNKIAKGT